MPRDKGWIKLYRDIFDSEIMNKPPHFREVWLFLLLKANHKDRYVSGRLIERGQTITSYKEIIQALSWKGGKAPFEYTDNNIQSALRYLETSGMIIKDKSAKKILVTIVNYKDYQQKENEVIHDKSTINPQSIHDESTNSPHHKQELKNERSVYRENTHHFSLNEIQEMFKKIASKQGRRLPVGVAEDFFNHYSANGWKRSTGARIENIESLIKQWITSKKPAAAKN